MDLVLLSLIVRSSLSGVVVRFLGVSGEVKVGTRDLRLASTVFLYIVIELNVP
jgi:hypothetical protein